jgi:hypothetical protein
MISKSACNRAGLAAVLALGVALAGCKDKGDKAKTAEDEAPKAEPAEAPAKAEPAKAEPAKPAPAEDVEPVQAEGLPKGEEVLDRYAEALGPKAAHEKVKNRLVKATVSMPKMGFEGSMTLYQAKPAKMYSLVEIAGIGKAEQGFDGEVAWEKSQMMGVRILVGDERAETIVMAMPDADLNWRKLYKEAVTVGIEEVDGKPAYKVVVTRNEGTRKTIWYDKESGLMVKTAFRMKSRLGEIPMTARLLDYREVDGLKIPFKTDGEMMSMQQIMTFTSVEHNVKLPDDLFVLPEDVAAVVANAAKKGAADAPKKKAPEGAKEKAPKKKGP